VHVMKNCEPLVFGPALACGSSGKAREQNDMRCGTAAHHGEKERSRVLGKEGFIFELLTINGFATSPYKSTSEIRVGTVV
jgi:hypothetical protein